MCTARSSTIRAMRGGGTALPTCEHIDRHLWWLPQRQNYSPEFEFGLLTLLLQPLVPNMKTSGDILAATSLNFYRPQRSWGKVMFLQASVILLTGGGAGPGSRWGGRGVCSGGGGGAWSAGKGGVPGPGGYLLQGGAWWRPPRMATAAGGMHPTRMHSCCP